MTYDLILTAVRDRADLLGPTVASILANVDVLPSRVLVHEDTRHGVKPSISTRTEDVVEAAAAPHGVPSAVLRPNGGPTGLGFAVLRLLEKATSDFVLYSQEDFDILRPVPVGKCIETMRAHGLHHVRFNKRDTMAVKGAHRPAAERFHKVEVTVGDVVLCVSDHWYFQLSVWRRDLALACMLDLAHANGWSGTIERVEAKFNRWMNERAGVPPSIAATDARAREKVLTFIWGRIGEPAFIRHTGSERRTQGWE